MKKILMVGNTDFSIYNYRKELVKKLIEDGYKVIIIAPIGDYFYELIDLGCEYININLSSYGINPLFELKTLLDYFRILIKIKPDIILTYTIKPNTYVGFLSRILNIPYIVNITGLGIAIENEGLLQKISILLLKIGIKKANTIFFQNQSNIEFLKKRKINIDNALLIPGSGVNLKEHPFEQYPNKNNNLNFLFIGRIIKSKGVEELFDLINYLDKEYSEQIKFHICGSYEDEYSEIFSNIISLNSVSYYGKVKNIHDYITMSNVVILPTHHEGLANVLLEAAAAGRPVIASNIPGCIETFDEGVSGLGFEVKNSYSLINTIEKFINLPYELKREMGINGRKKIEKEFNREDIVNIYIEKINSI